MTRCFTTEHVCSEFDLELPARLVQCYQINIYAKFFLYIVIGPVSTTDTWMLLCRKREHTMQSRHASELHPPCEVFSRA